MRRESKYRDVMQYNFTLYQHCISYTCQKHRVKTPRYGKIKIGHKGRPMFDMIIIIKVM